MRLRLNNNINKIIQDEKSNVIVITDRNTSDIFELLDCENINWKLKLIHTLDQLKRDMDEKMITYLIKFDLVLIMLDKNDIKSGKKFIKLSKKLEKVITLISDLGVEVRPIQVLPLKGANYRLTLAYSLMLSLTLTVEKPKFSELQENE